MERLVLIIREILTGREEAARSILDALPEWFGIPSAREAYINHASHAPMLGAEHEGRVVGYASLADHFGNNCEIHSMGVDPRWHRKGIGRELITAAARWAAGHGLVYLSVKTISDKHPDPNYAKTRAFYRAAGFHPFEELPTLWGKNLPCLVLVRPTTI